MKIEEPYFDELANLIALKIKKALQLAFQKGREYQAGKSSHAEPY